MAFQYQKGIDILELIQQKATKITRVLKYMVHKERLRELGLFEPEEGETLLLSTSI